MRRRSTPSARRSAVARCVERESARETQVLCEQPSCRGRPECPLYLSMASHRHGLCEGPRVGEDPGVPLSRGCEGGPQAPAVAARCGLAWLRGARRVRTGNVYVRDPLSCVHRECICVHSRVPFAMCVAQGARVWVDPGGGSSAPSRWRTAVWLVSAQQRSIARCLGVHTQGGKPQGTIERSVLGSRGTIKRSVSGGGGAIQIRQDNLRKTW